MTDTISQNRARHEREVERIRANRDLSAEAKRRMIAEAYEKALNEHKRLAEEERQQTERAIKQAERKVLGISYPEGAKPHERAIIAMSYRDARDRAERAAADREDPEALHALLEGAENADDAVLAEAAYHVATARGVRTVADAYLQEGPTARGRWESYVELR